MSDNFPLKDDSFWMAEAFKLAEKAFTEDEVPVGAIVVCHDRIIGKGYNQCESLNDATAHAEILAITAASNTLDNWRLDQCIMFVTKEPCVMCAGAINNARVNRVVFGAYDGDKGACDSLYQICGDKRLGSNTIVQGGIMEDKCVSIIKEFFSLKRDS